MPGGFLPRGGSGKIARSFLDKVWKMDVVLEMLLLFNIM
jgi:hypothetical protein